MVDSAVQHRQTAWTVIGSLGGAATWWWMDAMHSSTAAFLCAVDGGWAGVGLHGLVTGGVILAGRGGRSPRQYDGAVGRLIGGLLLVMVLLFLIIQPPLRAAHWSP